MPDIRGASRARERRGREESAGTGRRPRYSLKLLAALPLALAQLFAFFPRIFEQKRDCSQSKFSIANECECNNSPADSVTVRSVACRTTQMTTEAMDSLKVLYGLPKYSSQV